MRKRIRAAPCSELRLDPVAGLAAQCVAQVRVLHHPHHRLHQGLCVLRWDEEPLLFVGDQLAYAPGIGSDDRQAAGHGLHIGHAQWFMQAGQYETMAAVQLCQYVGLRDRAQQCDVRGKAETADAVLQHAALAFAATFVLACDGHVARQIWVRLLQGGQSLQQRFEPFDAVEAGA